MSPILNSTASKSSQCELGQCEQVGALDKCTGNQVDSSVNTTTNSINHDTEEYDKQDHVQEQCNIETDRLHTESNTYVDHTSLLMIYQQIQW